MVKIRLRRIGSKGHPVYRVVVAESAAGRNGKFIEILGSYDPVSQPKKLEVNEGRALHWLRAGAQPSETAARILNRTGVLPKFLDERPVHKKEFSFLDKRTAAISVSAPGSAKAESAKAEPAPEAKSSPVPEAAAESSPKAEVAETPATPSDVASESVSSESALPESSSGEPGQAGSRESETPPETAPAENGE